MLYNLFPKVITVRNAKDIIRGRLTSICICLMFKVWRQRCIIMYVKGVNHQSIYGVEGAWWWCIVIFRVWHPCFYNVQVAVHPCLVRDVKHQYVWWCWGCLAWMPYDIGDVASMLLWCSGVASHQPIMMWFFDALMMCFFDALMMFWHQWSKMFSIHDDQNVFHWCIMMSGAMVHQCSMMFCMSQCMLS